MSIGQSLYLLTASIVMQEDPNVTESLTVCRPITFLCNDYDTMVKAFRMMVHTSCEQILAALQERFSLNYDYNPDDMKLESFDKFWKKYDKARKSKKGIPSFKQYLFSLDDKFRNESISWISFDDTPSNNGLCFDADVSSGDTIIHHRIEVRPIPLMMLKDNKIMSASCLCVPDLTFRDYQLKSLDDEWKKRQRYGYNPD